MKLVSMKNEEKRPSPEVSSMKYDEPAYPYGLQISLDAESMKKLGIKDMPKVGTKMMIEATVEVCSVSMNESKFYGDNKRVELQITELGLGEGEEPKEDKE